MRVFLVATHCPIRQPLFVSSICSFIGLFFRFQWVAFNNNPCVRCPRPHYDTFSARKEISVWFHNISYWKKFLNLSLTRFWCMKYYWIVNERHVLVYKSQSNLKILILPYLEPLPIISVQHFSEFLTVHYNARRYKHLYLFMVRCRNRLQSPLPSLFCYQQLGVGHLN